MRLADRGPSVPEFAAQLILSVSSGADNAPDDLRYFFGEFSPLGLLGLGLSPQ